MNIIRLLILTNTNEKSRLQNMEFKKKKIKMKSCKLTFKIALATKSASALKRVMNSEREKLFYPVLVLLQLNLQNKKNHTEMLLNSLFLSYEIHSFII